jgi:hypothetical protein
MDQPENQRETMVYSQSQTRHYANPEETQQSGDPTSVQSPFSLVDGSCIFFFLVVVVV